MGKYKGILPKAKALSDWNRSEILYECRHCGASFAYAGDRNKFCYNCGEKQNWNVLRHMDVVYEGNDIYEIHRIINTVNRTNRENNKGD